MSRQVIRDIVIPIIERVMVQNRYYPSNRWLMVRDPHLEEYLEEEMRRHFGVIGANGCQHLREQLAEAMRNDPYSFELLIKRMLERYVKLRMKLQSARKIKKNNSRKREQSQTSKRRKKIQAQ